MSFVTLRNILFGRSHNPLANSTSPGSLESQNGAVTARKDPERQPLLGAVKQRDSFSSSTLASSHSSQQGDEEEDATVQGEDDPHGHNDEGQQRFRVDARIIADATIGLADGLTVPFALTAGLSALGETKVVVYGGLAELIAGAISMGLGGYLGAKSEAASYRETRTECTQLAESDPARASATALRSLFAGDAAAFIPPSVMDDLATHLAAAPASARADLLLRAKHGADACSSEDAVSSVRSPAVSAATIALGYLLGGLLPLAPYFFIDGVERALVASVVVMVFALFTFGYGKTCAVAGWTGRENVWQGFLGGLEMVVVGGMAAGAAMGFVKLFDGLRVD